VKGSYSPDYGLGSGKETDGDRIKLPVYINPDYAPGSRRRIARGSYIRTWMRKLHLDYDTVAKVLGVHPITVRNWEKSKSVRPIVKMAFDQAFRRDKPAIRYRVPLVPDPYAPDYFTCRPGCKVDGPHRVPIDCTEGPRS